VSLLAHEALDWGKIADQLTELSRQQLDWDVAAGFWWHTARFWLFTLSMDLFHELCCASHPQEVGYPRIQRQPFSELATFRVI
jgi:hypothetical protein